MKLSQGEKVQNDAFSLGKIFLKKNSRSDLPMKITYI
jgi:hypothetical protein